MRPILSQIALLNCPLIVVNFVFTVLCGPIAAAEISWRISFGDRFQNYGSASHDFATFSPDGRLAAICCRDRSIRLWGLVAGKELRRLIGHGDVPICIAFSPDGKRILSSSPQEYPRAAFRVWSVATGEMLFEDKTRLQGTPRILIMLSL